MTKIRIHEELAWGSDGYLIEMSYPLPPSESAQLIETCCGDGFSWCMVFFLVPRTTVLVYFLFTSLPESVYIEAFAHP